MSVSDRPTSARAGRRLDAGLHLLDRQIIDTDGRMAGKVDDLEFETRTEGPPYVSAVVSGPGALSARIGGRLGRWIASVHRRLRTSGEEEPARVSFGVVARIDNAVQITVSREVLDSDIAERLVRDHFIAHIPGAATAAPSGGEE